MAFRFFIINYVSTPKLRSRNNIIRRERLFLGNKGIGIKSSDLVLLLLSNKVKTTRSRNEISSVYGLA